jgi:hypothetical protein
MRLILLDFSGSFGYFTEILSAFLATAPARQPGVNQMSVNDEFPGSMRPWESMPAAKQGDGTA